MSTDDDYKRAVAHAALEELPAEGIVGLGSGSTAQHFLAALQDVVATGRRLVGVPTSRETRAAATAFGIPLLDDDGPWQIAVAFDGADEVDPALDLIKGHGGAHTREKIVSYAAAKTVIMVDSSKLCERLGERHAVPVEVLAFAHKTTSARLAQLGDAVQRVHRGEPVRTDGGNVIYDLHVGPIADPGQLELDLLQVPGVVETGLFIGRADVVLIGSSRRVERRVRS